MLQRRAFSSAVRPDPGSLERTKKGTFGRLWRTRIQRLLKIRSAVSLGKVM